MDIPYEKQFHFKDGSSAADIEQLKKKVEGISYQEFYHHVNTQKNDFSSWIRHVLHEEQLADDLQKVTSIVETVEILADYTRPRSALVSHADVQSRIEDQLFAHPLPTETNDKQLVVETVPTTTPIATTKEGKSEMLDFKIIEEKIGGEEGFNPQVSEELFGIEQTKHGSQPVQRSTMHDQDATRMIVKDFMYGLIFGLILGLILGRILSL